MLCLCVHNVMFMYLLHYIYMYIIFMYIIYLFILYLHVYCVHMCTILLFAQNFIKVIQP